MSRLSFILLAAAGIAFGASAQQSLTITTGRVSYIYDTDLTGVMTYTDGTTLTVDSRPFSLSDITSARVTVAEAPKGTVSITYADADTRVTVAGDIARYIDVTLDGDHVSITQSDLLSETSGGEITYRLSGTAADGSFTLAGSYKATLELSGLQLTSQRGAALDIRNGKRIKIKSTEGTANVLTDCAGGSQKGCITCKGHLEFSGKGALTVTGLTGHAIHAKEYVTVKNTDILVPSSVKDGINCAQYFTIESGSVTIEKPGDDGLQCSFKDDTDREAEDTGTITIAGGTITANASATAAKALKADGDFLITAGSVTASVTGGGMWDSEKSKTKASTCISADGNVTISGGELDLTATGSGGKGISCDGHLLMSDGHLTAKTSGGIFAYVNGTAYDNYTGNTDWLDSDAKSSPKGAKADGNMTITGGRIDITTTGNGGEGLESKAILTIEGGTIRINAYDDAINSSSHMYIRGGDIEVVASHNDGLDSNGNMYISGGRVLAFGTSSPECGIDVNDEDGYKLYFTGGYILGVGGGNSVPSSSESTQPYTVTSQSVTAGQTITISNGSETYAEFTVPAGYSGSSSQGGWGGGWGPGGGSGSSILISIPELVSGQSYTVTAGSSSTTATARTTGGGSGPGGRP